MLKRVFVVIVGMMIIFALCNIALAKDPFDPDRFNVTEINAENTTIRFVGNMIDVFQVFSVGVATIVLIVLGIKYMAAAPDGKAEIKKNMTTYGIGAVVVFSAAVIIEILQRFFALNIKGSEGGE